MVFREVTYEAIVTRILAAIVVGGLIGMERGMKNRPAGLRTYMLVCVGACLIMLTNQYIYQTTGVGDPMRLGAQVISGIGFLGAGTIVVTKHNQIRGLTTAAGLWASAGVGLAFGIGFYEGALVASIGIYGIMTLLHRFERRAHKKMRHLDIYVELVNTTPLSEFMQCLRNLDLTIEDIHFEPDGALDGSSRAIVFTLKSSKREDHLLLLEKLKQIPGVSYMEEL